MLLGADFHSQFPKVSNFSPPKPTYRCSFKEPFEGLGHSAVFTNDSPPPESVVNAPYRPHFPSAPVTLSSVDNVTVQLHFVRLAFSIAGDVVMAGHQQAHVDRILPNLRHTWQTRKSTRAQPACWRFLAAGFFSKVVMQEKISFYLLKILRICYRWIPSSCCLSSGFLHAISRSDHHGPGRRAQGIPPFTSVSLLVPCGVSSVSNYWPQSATIKGWSFCSISAIIALAKRLVVR